MGSLESFDRLIDILIGFASVVAIAGRMHASRWKLKDSHGIRGRSLLRDRLMLASRGIAKVLLWSDGDGSRIVPCHCCPLGSEVGYRAGMARVFIYLFLELLSGASRK